nr:Chain C, TANGO1 peptide3 [Homo sapiens]
LPPPFGPGM